MNWPKTIWDWSDLIFIASMGLFLLDKGRLMYIRSKFRDLLGWSLIANDLAIGIAYLFGTLVIIDPAKFFNSIEHKIVRIIVWVVLIFTWIVMRITKPNRMTKAIGGKPDV